VFVAVLGSGLTNRREISTMLHSLRVYLASFALPLALATPTLAAPLAPAKASDVVGLVSSNADCTGNGKRIGDRILPNGTVVPFEIPPKRVFVITSAEIELGGVAAGEYVRATLFVETDTPATATAVALLNAVGGANGIAIGSLTMPTGIVIARGSRLCLNSATSGGAYVHGFLAKDK
jgi:hypothetical protein